MNRRTALITAGAVAGTLLAGTGAIAANIAVLNSADDDSIGNLSAEMPVITEAPAAQVIDVYIEDPTPTTATPTTEATTSAGQEYTVEEAGSVTLRVDDGTLIVDSVATNPGWQWSPEQASPTEVHVSFTNPDKTYDFFATLAVDGTIEARVDQPIINVVKVPAPDNGGSADGGGGGNGTANQPPAAANPETPPADNGGYNDDDDDDDDHDEPEDDDYEEPEDDYEEPEDDGHEDDDADEPDDDHEDEDDD